MKSKFLNIKISTVKDEKDSIALQELSRMEKLLLPWKPKRSSLYARLTHVHNESKTHIWCWKGSIFLAASSTHNKYKPHKGAGFFKKSILYNL